jgi:hypothetical protein
MAACLLVPPAYAQDAPQTAAASPAASSATLISGTALTVSLDTELSTATNKVGDRFPVTVVNDVIEQGVVVIPKGTTGYGEVTFATRKGGFGKQGILGIALRYLNLNGRQFMLDGRYREEGRGNEGAAAATMFAVGIFAFVVKGKTATIPKGRELKAHTGEDIPFPAALPVAATVPAPADSAATITPVSTTAPAENQSSTPN